uniref:EamA family transporter n=1 Tax=Acidobacterium capsulatum TaxID=33075 RepID=A0A7V4XSL5_9BACT
MPSSASHAGPARLAVLLAFGSVYFFWGATYTAMSIGVHLLPAPILAGTRMLIGAALMLLFCKLRGKKIFYARSVMARLGLLGVMLLFMGNVGLVWSEKYLASGLAALIVAIVPLYVAVIEAISGGEQLRRRGLFGLFLGFLALISLLWPSFHEALLPRHGNPMQIVAAIIVLLGALSFASGSVLSRHMQLPVPPLVAAGWEMGAAGLANVVLATATWQWSQAIWNWHSIAAIGYLILFGSLLGFSCYIWLIHHVPVAKVATYAYVNPVVAVILGVLVLHEHMQPTEYIGMVAVIASVALVTSSQMKSGKPAAAPAPVENEA